MDCFLPELDKYEVTDKSVQAFAENCPDLQFVGFMGCSVTSQGVIHLTRLQHLSSLDLRHISELNNETVMEVVRKCRNLTSLNLCLNWTINDRSEMLSQLLSKAIGPQICCPYAGKRGFSPLTLHQTLIDFSTAFPGGLRDDWARVLELCLGREVQQAAKLITPIRRRTASAACFPAERGALLRETLESGT
ncbi:hypothetical protein QQF64_031264 [Cirrhinus molitorella]|uniref:Uncharacterized protein n=1 Tax=Cirrhinus molitorella TaxID=172907 RepID=A0ABR3MWN1_9TELE